MNFPHSWTPFFLVYSILTYCPNFGVHYSILDEIFPEYQRVPFFSNLFGQASRALLKIAPIPAKILALPIEALVEYLVFHSKGRLGWERAWRKADLIYRAARSSIGSKVVASALEECMRDLLYELERLEDRISFFTKEIEDRLSLTPGKILISIPGVGPVTAATITSEIGDISQFRSADALVCAIVGLSLLLIPREPLPLSGIAWRSEDNPPWPTFSIR